MPITTEPPRADLVDGQGFFRFEGNYQGKPWSNTIYCTFDRSGDPADPAAVASDAFDAWAASLLVSMKEDNHLTKCTFVYHDGGFLLEGAHIGSEDGGAIGEGVNTQVAVVVSWRIAEHYRGGKPRSYLAGAPYEGLDTYSSWSDDFVTTVSAHAVDFIAAMNAIDGNGFDVILIGVMHFFRAGAALDPPEFSPFITGAVQKRVCTQRRRLGSEF